MSIFSRVAGYRIPRFAFTLASSQRGPTASQARASYGFALKALGALGVAGTAYWVWRAYELWGDQVFNPLGSFYLDFVERERLKGNVQIGAWRTGDSERLRLWKEFGDVDPFFDLEPKEGKGSAPVEFFSCHPDDLKDPSIERVDILAVGGPPALMTAVQGVSSGKSVLYMSGAEDARPIYSGAANHIEADFDTEGPAYTAGKDPLWFLGKRMQEWIHPPRYDRDVLSPDFLWLNLNYRECFVSPRQWGELWRVAYKTQLLSNAFKAGKMEQTLLKMQKEVHQGGDWLEKYNEQLGGELLMPIQGSLILARSSKDEEGLMEQQKRLAKEGKELRRLSSEEVVAKYGFLPRDAVAFFEKTHDRVLRPDFQKRIIKDLKSKGAKVSAGTLVKVGIAEDGTHGIAYFKEGRRIHFNQVYLSLGGTRYEPEVCDLVSVTGVTVNALVIGKKMAPNPIVTNGSVHLVPLAHSQQIDDQWVTPVRVTTAGSVGPRDRGERWQHTDGRYAAHLVHQVRMVLPEEMRFKLISVRGCNRLVSSAGISAWYSPTLKSHEKISCVKIQAGAGGGGLTQSAKMAAQV